MKNNDVVQYVNQKKQIEHGEDFCGAACVSMLTGEDPQMIANILGSTADDTTLTDYLKRHGYAITKIVDGGSAGSHWAFMPDINAFQKMREAIFRDEVIIYHFAGWDHKSSGHYAICKG